MAFLRAGIDPEEEIFCHGESEIGDTRIGCSAHRYANGDMNMVSALEKSCNNYMIHHSTAIGLDKITPVIDSVGFGRKCGLPIPENSGDRPSPELKKQRYNTRWNEYDTALLSIGQGIISVTPLQLAVYTAAIANGGTVWKPQLVKEMRDVRQVVKYKFSPEAVGELPVTGEQLAIIRQGMLKVVNSSGGSGRWGRVDGLDIYGKTGTAEVGPKHQRRHITHFIAFTSYENRRYAVAVTVEDGGSGGKTCAPLAAEFFKRFLLTPASR
jgi:penicillin-binding protein 2